VGGAGVIGFQRVIQRIVGLTVNRQHHRIRLGKMHHLTAVVVQRHHYAVVDAEDRMIRRAANAQPSGLAIPVFQIEGDAQILTDVQGRGNDFHFTALFRQKFGDAGGFVEAEPINDQHPFPGVTLPDRISTTSATPGPSPPGMAVRLGSRAGRHDHRIRFGGQHRIQRRGDAGLYLDPQLFNLVQQIPHDVAEFGAARDAHRPHHLPAQPIFLFQQRDPMPAASGNGRGFQSGRAAADHQHPFGFGDGCSVPMP
jgi:hypothetical protein